jgi:hypothetical protein
MRSILGNNTGGGTIDIVWGPDVELIESKSDAHLFLGEEKYKPHLNSIYAGLGIPPTLTGTFGAAGTTNNFISLKTLTQRLQYGRDVLVEFWEKELEIVQKSMGFKIAAKIEFDRMDLSNEDAEKALLIQLADRNVISDELLQLRFGIDPSMEKSRLNRESRDRDGDRMVQKAGPYFVTNFENELRKIALQLGIATPSQVGLELENNKRGEKNAIQMKSEFNAKLTQQQKPAGVSGQGRPKTKKDSQPRQTKRFAPQTGAALALWANDTQDKIGEIVNPIYLEFVSKANLRKLSSTESQELETLKTRILFNIEPYAKIESDGVINLMAETTIIDSAISNEKLQGFNYWLRQIQSELNRSLTMEEIKSIKSSFYSAIYSQKG